MSAEQVVRAAIIKQMESFSYEDVAFHLLDSVCYRGFCRVGITDKGFHKSALCNNIKAITPKTWEAINHIFEPHIGIIVKDRRGTFYGHKICLSGGAPNLITDCLILDGNSAGTELADQMLDRHKEIYGHYPPKVALDGGFASEPKLDSSKGKGIKDVCFAKKRGLEVEEMCRSSWVYKRLRRFRAGIESGISWLKRCFGLIKCMWRSLRSFKSNVWASIVSANLLTLARVAT